MAIMKTLKDMIDAGFRIKISELITQGTVFPMTDTDGVATLVFHPCDYSYLAFEDPFEAHYQNVHWLEGRIERMAEAACERIDKMTDAFNNKFEPKIVTFFPNVEVEENEDGNFTFRVVNPYGVDEERVFQQNRPMVVEYMKGSGL